jgi:hypothetical protein
VWAADEEGGGASPVVWAADEEGGGAAAGAGCAAPAAAELGSARWGAAAEGRGGPLVPNGLRAGQEGAARAQRYPGGSAGGRAAAADGAGGAAEEGSGSARARPAPADAPRLPQLPPGLAGLPHGHRASPPQNGRTGPPQNGDARQAERGSGPASGTKDAPASPGRLSPRTREALADLGALSAWVYRAPSALLAARSPGAPGASASGGLLAARSPGVDPPLSGGSGDAGAVRGAGGRDVSGQYGRRGETCPVSTGGRGEGGSLAPRPRAPSPAPSAGSTGARSAAGGGAALRDSREYARAFFAAAPPRAPSPALSLASRMREVRGAPAPAPALRGAAGLAPRGRIGSWPGWCGCRGGRSEAGPALSRRCRGRNARRGRSGTGRRVGAGRLGATSSTAHLRWCGPPRAPARPFSHRRSMRGLTAPANERCERTLRTNAANERCERIAPFPVARARPPTGSGRARALTARAAPAQVRPRSRPSPRSGSPPGAAAPPPLRAPAEASPARAASPEAGPVGRPPLPPRRWDEAGPPAAGHSGHVGGHAGGSDRAPSPTGSRGSRGAAAVEALRFQTCARPFLY